MHRVRRKSIQKSAEETAMINIYCDRHSLLEETGDNNVRPVSPSLAFSNCNAEVKNRNPVTPEATSTDNESENTKDENEKEKNATLTSANNPQPNFFAMQSSAEIAKKQKVWMTIYFRYRMPWHVARVHLEKMRREEAYEPQNLHLWTKYVIIELHRKRAFLDAIKAFRNRVLSPESKVAFTFDKFHRVPVGGEKISEEEKATQLPIFCAPDDLPKFRNLDRASTNIFVTAIDSPFDKLWNEAIKALDKEEEQEN